MFKVPTVHLQNGTLNLFVVFDDMFCGNFKKIPELFKTITTRLRFFILFLSLLSSNSALSNENMAVQTQSDELKAIPETPELPAPIQSGEEMQPDITIIKKGKETIQEFRKNGQLYMIKVVPQIGPSYYLLDTNGDGKLDVKQNDIDKTSNINQWILFEWD